MPAILCKCGNRLGYDEIPNPIEWLIIPDKDFDFDGDDGMVNSSAMYEKMKSFLKCSSCGRLWFFWDGFESEPISYKQE